MKNFAVVQNFAVVRSLDAPGHVSLDEFYACTQQMAAGLKAMGRSMPPVLLLHVPESAADILGVGRTGVIRHNRSDNAGLANYYEIWLVGKPGLADYVLALQGIFDDYLALKKTSHSIIMTQQ
jgi:hypothetical protein